MTMDGAVTHAERGFGIEPHLSLAFAVHSTPGAYALLLGAGVSVAAAVPSAWGVQAELIRRLAHAEGDHPDDPFAWYYQRFDRPSTYSDLLDALTRTQADRQALLREFFEPNDQEREEGLKQPTTAHRAIARLVARGLVRVILTINFDRLVETALRGEGIEPTVVGSPSDIRGLSPLHALRCLVVHLHGDYLHATGMLNTAEELDAYPREVNDLLDRILQEYGLVIAGWSATWDPALRDAITRNPNRFYATYWIDPHSLSEVAQDLRTRRRATYVQVDANTFFGRLMDACDAIADIGGRHPLTTQIAVATAKRALAGTQTAIPLHDTIHREMELLRSTNSLNPVHFNLDAAKQTHARRLQEIEAALEVPLALIATSAYWGDQSTDAWWFDDIARFAVRPNASGSAALIALVRLPATAILYAAGIAAVGARRDGLLVRLLTEPTTTNNQDELVPVASHLTPTAVWGLPRAHRRLHLLLRPMFEDHLGLGAAAYRDASERFEYLRLVQATFETLRRNDLHDQGPSLERKISALEAGLMQVDPIEAAMQGGTAPSADEITARKEELARARDAARQARDQLTRYTSVGVPHLSAHDHRNRYTASTAEILEVEINRDGAAHPLLRAGLCGGNVDQLRWSMLAVDDAFHAFADEAAWSTLPPGGGTLPSGHFLPDEIGKWSKAAGG